jgi:hypothetical protein
MITIDQKQAKSLVPNFIHFKTDPKFTTLLIPTWQKIVEAITSDFSKVLDAKFESLNEIDIFFGELHQIRLCFLQHS